MNPEECWEQTRRKWERCAINPLGPTEGCGFCRFSNNTDCIGCPVVKVYGGSCEETVELVKAYYSTRYTANPDVEELSILAEAVVQELDDKKDELIAAMYEILRI